MVEWVDYRMNRRLYLSVSALLALSLIDETARAMTLFSFDVLEGIAPAPYQYRLLFALVFTPMVELLTLPVAVWAFWTLLLFLFALLFDEWLREWASPPLASTWTLCAVLVVFSTAWFQSDGLAWSVTEAVFWLGTLLILRNERHGWLFPLVFIATLNRETTIFLVILVWLITRRKRLTGGLALVWVATYGAIRLYIGAVAVQSSLHDIFALNIERLPWTLMGLLLYGWLPLWAFRGYRRAPEMLRRAAWVSVPYLGAVVVFGAWREFRLWIPLLSLLVPLAMYDKISPNGRHQGADCG